MQPAPILLPDMPVIDGLSFRYIAGEADADAIYAIHAGRVTRDGVDRFSSYEDFPSREALWAELARLVADQQHLHLVAQVHDQVVGYSLLESWAEDDGRWVYLILGWVLPEWRGRGLGTAMLHWCERTARQLAATEHPGEPFEFAANASSTEQDTTALLLNEGYVAGFTVLEMDLDLSIPQPEHALPPGIEVRPVLPEHYPLIAASVAEAYRDEYAGSRYQETFDQAEYVATLSAPPHDATLWQVAWDGDCIAGQVIPLIDANNWAEIYEVSVRPAYRRKGLARALLTRSLQRLRERSPQVIRLRTVAEFRTRASDLYRSVGFRVLKEFPRYRKSPG